MAEQTKDTAQTYARRRAKNLDFFRKQYPSIYKHFVNFLMEKTEVVVSPKENDIDLQVEGKSLYGGRAKAVAIAEANEFLSVYSTDSMLRTFTPPWPDMFKTNNYATQSVRNAAALSPVRRDNFHGYPMEGFFPFVVFLGCGLGYQVEEMVRRVDIVDAVIFEPDPEVFSASLFAVDWEEICSRFLKRKGYTITFSIGLKADRAALVELLEKEMVKRAPLYPTFTLYFNHLANPLMNDIAGDVRRNLPTFFSGLGNYDDEVRRLNNTLHNLERGIRVISASWTAPTARPVLLVGSGPSIDERLEDIRSVREQVIIVTAGTGLRGMLANGITPDYHLELDPDYIVYQTLSEMGRDRLRGITFLAVNEVNPKVFELFDQKFVYFKKDNPSSRLFGLEPKAFERCNPTCMNAALSIFATLGFEDIYLFGADFGFKSAEKHHSSSSVFGVDDGSEVNERVRRFVEDTFDKSRFFEIPAVDGSTVLTKSDYYSAKASVEALISLVKPSRPGLSVSNCSDGAAISETHWLDSWSFVERVRAAAGSAGNTSVDELNQLFREQSTVADTTDLSTQVRGSCQQIDKRCKEIVSVVKAARLRGKRDLVALINSLTELVVRIRVADGMSIPSGSQTMAQHVMRGSLVHHLSVGLNHSLAIEDHSVAVDFMNQWREDFLDFVRELPTHFRHVVSERRPVDEDDWVMQSLRDPDGNRVVEEAPADD